MTKLHTAFVLLLISPFLTYAQWQCSGSQNTANCPPCYFNQNNRPNNGSINGQLVVNVYLDSSWDVSPGQSNAHVYNAVFGNGTNVQGGTGMWNNAVDTTSNPGTTNRPPYYFQNGQSGGFSRADDCRGLLPTLMMRGWHWTVTITEQSIVVRNCLATSRRSLCQMSLMASLHWPSTTSQKRAAMGME